MSIGVHEACNMARQPISTIGAALASGALPARKQGKSWRIDEADLRRWLAERRAGAGQPR
jgi:excisionase family DNA binding protein